MKQESQPSVQSLDRVFQIIEALSESPQGLPLREVCQKTGLAKSTASRLLSALIQNSYAFQDPGNKKYALTLRLFELSSRVVGGMNILSVAKPYLNQLSTESSGAVHLVSRVNDEVVYLYKEEALTSVVRMSSCVGLHNPMYCVGVGKALLAYLPDEEIKAIWSRTKPVKFTPYTITTFDELYKELCEIRQRGYAIDNQEHELGIRCVAVPIFDLSGNAIAAISISDYNESMTDEKIADYVPNLLETSQKISRYYGVKYPKTQVE